MSDQAIIRSSQCIHQQGLNIANRLNNVARITAQGKSTYHIIGIEDSNTVGVISNMVTGVSLGVPSLAASGSGIPATSGIIVSSEIWDFSGIPWRYSSNVRHRTV